MFAVPGSSSVIATVGAAVSTVTDVADEFAPALPAMSVIRAVTSNVPLPCAPIVPDGTATVALPPVMSPATSV